MGWVRKGRGCLITEIEVHGCVLSSGDPFRSLTVKHANPVLACGKGGAYTRAEKQADSQTKNQITVYFDCGVSGNPRVRFPGAPDFFPVRSGSETLERKK